MQAAMFGDHFGSWSQPQVKGIAQHDLRANLREFVRHHGFDRSVGANRHKHGSLDNAVIQRYPPASRQAIGSEKFKAQPHLRVLG
jgi:hypothetical protein